MQTTTSEFDVLAARVEQLEKQNRRWKRGALGVFLLAASVIVMGQARPNTTVGGQSFVLRDASGGKRAELVLEAESPRATPSPTLRFFDDKGNQTLLLSSTRLELAGQSDMGTNIILDDAKGVARANFGLAQDQSFVLLNDAKGVPRIRMELNHDQPKIALQDARELPRLGLVLANDEPAVALDDAQGFSAVFGSTSLLGPGAGRATSAASLVLFNKDGAALWSAP